MSEPAPTQDPGDWTGPRPRVSGTPVVIGAIVIGLVIVAMLASVTNRPGTAALLSQDYTSMMAGLLAPEVQTTDPSALASALVQQGLPFVPRIVALEPDFRLLGGRRHKVEAREAAAWFYRAPSAEMAIAEAFEGNLDELGAPDETRTDGARPMRVYRKTTQTIVCWQDGSIVYTFASTLPTEVVLRLSRRLVAPVDSAR